MTVKQLQARLSPLERKIARLRKELDDAKARQKELKTNLAEAKKAEKDSASKAKAAPKKRTTKRKTTRARAKK